MYGEITPICCENHTGHMKTVCGQIAELGMLNLMEHNIAL